MQMLEDFPIGLKETGFVIRDVIFLAESFDDLLGFLQFVPRYSWEQMVLNLVIQCSIPEIGHGMRSHIAGTQDLLMQKVQRALFI